MTENPTPEEARRAASSPEPDAYGQAALLLVESLIHRLISLSLISVADAVEIVDVAAEVKAEIAVDLGHTPAKTRTSLIMLEMIGLSLRADLR